MGCNCFSFIAFIGLIQVYQKKNQIRLDSDLVTCIEKQNYSVLHLLLFQKLYIPAKGRFLLPLED